MARNWRAGCYGNGHVRFILMFHEKKHFCIRFGSIHKPTVMYAGSVGDAPLDVGG